MTKTSKTTIFFGNERLATGVTTEAPTLRGLLNSGYEVAAVVSHNEAGKSRSNRRLEIEDVAKSYNIPVLLPHRLSDIREQITASGAEVGVLVAYGKIIPQTIIDLFPCGIVNIHPSLLPLHRGPTPIESVILNGEAKTGVTIMRLVKEMDAGPILAQEELKLTGSETKQELATKLLNIGAQLLVDTLPSLLGDTVKAEAQDASIATYDKLIKKQDGVINWQQPARQIERQIRAYLAWPKSHTKLAGVEVAITQAGVVESNLHPGEISINDKNLIVGTASDALRIIRLTPSGKKEMSAEAFLAGYRRLLAKESD